MNRDSAVARVWIPLDREGDAFNKPINLELTGLLTSDRDSISRCLNLLIATRSFERIAADATKIAEDVVYRCEAANFRQRGAVLEPPGGRNFLRPQSNIAVSIMIAMSSL